MSKLREEGKLWLTTIAEYMEHQEAINQLEYNIHSNYISIKNNQSAVVKGLTIAVLKDKVSDDFIENNNLAHYRYSKNDLIFWLDLAGNTELKLFF